MQLDAEHEMGRSNCFETMRNMNFFWWVMYLWFSVTYDDNLDEY